MHKSFFSMVVMAAVVLLSSQASATTRPIKPVSYASLANSCAAAGGQSWGSAGSSYGCTKNNCDGKGGTCGVQCEKGKCHGVTPIVAGNAPSTVFGVLNPKPQQSRGPGPGLLDNPAGLSSQGGPSTTGRPAAPAGAAPAGGGLR
jgi:hypothetical protein